MLETIVMLVLYGTPACVTVLGSRRRGNAAGESFLQGLMWPATWIMWFVNDNLAAGRDPFQGHSRRR